MKAHLLLSTFAFWSFAQPALAEITRRPITDAEVIVFDAVCTPVTQVDGYLKVDLQADKTADSLFVRGTFYSYSEASSMRDPQKWHLIPIAECRELQSELTQNVGRRILLNGQTFERAYEAYEDVWGTCREHPRAGGGTYPCKKGTRKVTKIDREVVLDLGGTYILNKNNN